MLKFYGYRYCRFVRANEILKLFGFSYSQSEHRTWLCSIFVAQEAELLTARAKLLQCQYIKRLGSKTAVLDIDKAKNFIKVESELNVGILLFLSFVTMFGRYLFIFLRLRPTLSKIHVMVQLITWRLVIQAHGNILDYLRYNEVTGIS